MTSSSSDMLWVIFNLRGEQFAVFANNVREMVAMPKVSDIPKTPDYMRGVVNLRGQVIPVMDLRLRMEMPSLASETKDLIDLLTQREQDHMNWIAELKLSVKENREFKLATDPHKCAFGKWYDVFQTSNGTLLNCLAKFNQPHKDIHGIAVKVKAMLAGDEFDSACELIDHTADHELAEMIKLFAEARTLLKESINEIALVLEVSGKTTAISVDSVETVEMFPASNIENMPEAATTRGNDFIAGIGKREKTNKMVQLIDGSALLGYETEAVA